jgi:outer membrane biosynthesis protein TonB
MARSWSGQLGVRAAVLLAVCAAIVGTAWYVSAGSGGRDANAPAKEPPVEAPKIVVDARPAPSRVEDKKPTPAAEKKPAPVAEKKPAPEKKPDAEKKPAEKVKPQPEVRKPEGERKPEPGRQALNRAEQDFLRQVDRWIMAQAGVRMGEKERGRGRERERERERERGDN